MNLMNAENLAKNHIIIMILIQMDVMFVEKAVQVNIIKMIKMMKENINVKMNAQKINIKKLILMNV